MKTFSPDFIGIGAQKSATSWLFACLDEHPGACLPTKEIHFFSREEQWRRGGGWYARQFSRCLPSQITGEFSTSYLCHPEAASRIAGLYPEARLVVSLRNPVDRAISNYRNDVMAGTVSPGTPFAAALGEHPEYVDQGRYAQQLARYRERFDDDALLVLLYEDIVCDPGSAIFRLFAFLGLDSGFRPRALSQRVNPSRVLRSPRIERAMNQGAAAVRRAGLSGTVRWARRSGLASRLRDANTQTGEAQLVTDDARRALFAHFETDIDDLRGMIGRDLREWLP